MSFAVRTAPTPLPTAAAAQAAAAQAERREDPLGGILLLSLSLVIFSCSDATAKYLTGELPVFEVIWLRYLAFATLLVPSAMRGGRAVLRSSRPGLQLARGLCMLGSGLLFVSALAFLPLADATSIGFISPLFITALSIPFLGEQVGVRRWAAIVVGLIGVLIVVRPGTSAFQPAALLPVVSAFIWAIAVILTRKLSGVDGTVTTLVYSSVSALVVMTVLVPFEWVTPSWRQLGLGVLYGMFATGGQWLIVLAYHRAAASVLAPLNYSQLVWSAALGFLVFHAVPDAWTLVGAAVIIGSGLYTAHRERVRGRAAG